MNTERKPYVIRVNGVAIRVLGGPKQAYEVVSLMDATRFAGRIQASAMACAMGIREYEVYDTLRGQMIARQDDNGLTFFGPKSISPHGPNRTPASMPAHVSGRAGCKPHRGDTKGK